MRDYSKISPKFWIGQTGKKLRVSGMESQLVSLYLMTCPTSNMIGLFYCPISYVAHETGLTIEGATKGLASSIDAGFCEYDEASEMVWVIEMAEYQIAAALKAEDKRCAGVQNEYSDLPDNPFLSRFFDKYSAAFNMTKKRGEDAKPASPFVAPSKPLASQEQEQEQEQEQAQEQEQGAGTFTPPEKSGVSNAKQKQNAPLESLLSLGVDEQAAKDWLTVRKAKRAPFTETALNDLKLEAGKAGITVGQAVAICAKKSWQGFNAGWNWSDEKPADSKFQTASERRMAVTDKSIAEWLGEDSAGNVINGEYANV